MSRRQRQRHQGTYDAALVPKIAKAKLLLPSALLAECEDASSAMVRFDAEATAVLGSGELAPLPAVLLRSESAASSQIEHLTVGARQLALAELGAPASHNAKLVSGNVAAMRAALDLADSIDISTVLTMHRALMGADDLYSGRLREQQVWIGGAAAGPHGAMFVPPHHTRVAAAMKDLLAFVERTDIPVIAHAALAHAHFETIHPFTDGNGRTGRALIHAMSRHAGLTQRVTAPISTTSAQSAIDLLVSARLLEPFDTKRRRNRVWQADEVLSALDAFAARAGRRR